MPNAGFEPLAGTGAFQWNLGGWLGGQLGGTLWILILSVLVGIRDPLAGFVLFLCFALPNLFGWWLWRRRDRVQPYPAIQRLIVAEGAFALLVVASLHLRDALQHLPEQSQVSLPTMYGVLLVYPGLLLMFHFQERAARGSGSQGIN